MVMKGCTNYYSYDVFDTCLVRACGNPLCVFDIMANRILSGKNIACKMDFAQERINGELRARTKFVNPTNEDITLEQIYSCCDFSIWTNWSNKEIQNIELRVESEMLLPVRSIQNEIMKHRAEGAKIIFISDMYLDDSFILSILVKSGIFQDGDSLFVSCNCGSRKSTGNLYQYVKDKLTIDPKRWIHCGDNYYSDVFIPKKLGIKAYRVSHTYSYYERLLLSKDFSSQCFFIKILASISRSLVCRYGTSSEVLFASDFVAPLYVLFVLFVLEDAKSRGIAHLYFCARDGYILKVIAENVINLVDRYNNMTTNYLYVSRKSLYAPGFNQLDTDNREGTQRELCYKYFDQEGLTKKKCAIVDLRGTRKCHVAINNILNYYGAPSVFGYYLEVVKDRICGSDYEAILFGERYNRNPINCCFEPSGLFEQYFSITDQKRTCGYELKDDKIYPLFEEEDGDMNYRRKISRINMDVCKDFALLFLKISPSTLDYRHLCEMIVSVYSDFAMAPSKTYLNALSELVLTDSNDSCRPLLKHHSFFTKGDKSIWYVADKVYNSIVSQLITWYYRIRIEYLRFNQGW